MNALWVAKGLRWVQGENFDGCSIKLWVAKGPRFLQEENFDGYSMGSQGSMVSSRGKL